eukprot:8711751-Karenia_brevis.AAC.1
MTLWVRRCATCNGRGYSFQGLWVVWVLHCRAYQQTLLLSQLGKRQRTKSQPYVGNLADHLTRVDESAYIEAVDRLRNAGIVVTPTGESILLNMRSCGFCSPCNVCSFRARDQGTFKNHEGMACACCDKATC